MHLKSVRRGNGHGLQVCYALALVLLRSGVLLSLCYLWITIVVTVVIIPSLSTQRAINRNITNALNLLLKIQEIQQQKHL